MKQIVEKSRYLALIGVIGLLIAAIAAFGWGLYKTGLLVYEVTIGVSTSTAVIVDLVKIVDFFLIATTLLIFAASLYELFITEIDVPDWMIAHNLYELKSKLSSMIVLVLAVKFLEEVFLAKDAYDLMLTGIAIAVISAVLIAFSYFGKKD
jgi:uncharacterized membrane protein YqhA